MASAILVILDSKLIYSLFPIQVFRVARKNVMDWKQPVSNITQSCCLDLRRYEWMFSYGRFWL